MKTIHGAFLKGKMMAVGFVSDGHLKGEHDDEPWDTHIDMYTYIYIYNVFIYLFILHIYLLIYSFIDLFCLYFCLPICSFIYAWYLCQVWVISGPRKGLGSVVSARSIIISDWTSCWSCQQSWTSQMLVILAQGALHKFICGVYPKLDIHPENPMVSNKLLQLWCISISGGYRDTAYMLVLNREHDTVKPLNFGCSVFK